MNLPKKTLYISIIISLIIGIYFNTFKNAFQFDDIIHVLNNEGIKSPSNLTHILKDVFSRPLLFATFAINFYISGSSVIGYHVVNILLHICVSIFICLILLHTTKICNKSTPHSISLTPFLSALIFALHPINTESVTYIMSRSSILSAFFYLLSLLMFIKGNKKRYEIASASPRNDKSPFIFYILAILFFIFALGSKEDAATLPVIAFFYYFFFPNKKSPNIKIVLFFAAIGLIYPVIRYFKFGILGTEEAAGIYTQFTYLLTEINAITFYYLKLFFLPMNLNVDPDIRPIVSILNLSLLISLLIILLMIVIAFKFRKKDPIISFSIVWFFVTLTPSSSIFPLLDSVAEHRAYLSVIGFSIFSARAIERIYSKYGYLVPSLLIVILLSLSLCTIKRNFVWKDRVSLWEDAVKKSPSKARPHAALGLAYNQEKRLIDEAIRQYRIALAIKPFYLDALINMGVALSMKGDIDGAMRKYEIALMIKPDSPELHNNIGIIYAQKGEKDKAIEEFKRTLTLAPNYLKARRNLEIALKRMTNFEGSTTVDSYR